MNVIFNSKLLKKRIPGLIIFSFSKSLDFFVITGSKLYFVDFNDNNILEV